MTLLASLAFLLATFVALGAIAGSVLRYRDSVLADLAAHRDVAATRDFDFRVFAFGRQPSMPVGKVRHATHRAPVRRAIAPAGWRAAA